MTSTATRAATDRRHHRLSLVCVNDVYSFDDRDSSAAIPRGGWCRAATLMKKLGRKNDRTEAPEDESSLDQTFLTVVNGDVLGGSSLLLHCQGSAAIEVMNSIPIDLAVLGNHEFDYGDEALIERVKESDFAWLGSNVYYPCQSESDKNLPLQQSVNSESQVGLVHYFPGIHGNGKIYNLSDSLKLGVFGLVTKVTPKISNPSDKVVFDHDILSVARRTAQSLREAGAHVIVAITHMSEAEDRLLAADKVASVDLIMGGHEHEPLAAMVHRNEDTGEDGVGEQDDNGSLLSSMEEEKHNEGGVLVFKCGMNAYWVGAVDLDIMTTCEENPKVTSISTSWAMHSVTSSTAEEDSAVSEIVRSHRKISNESAMVSAFGKEIASTIGLDDIVATIGDAANLSGAATTLPLDTRMSSVRRREATGGNLVADAMHWLLETNIRAEDNDSSSLPMLAMINGGFIRGDRLRAVGSAFTVRDVLKELPFPRTMKVLMIGGLHLKEAMSQQLEGSSNGPTGAYPHLSHNARLRYRLDRSSDANSTDDLISIHAFTVNGVEISDKQEYIVAVTSFVAEGKEGCSSWLKSTPVHNPAWEGFNMSRVLLKYLQYNPVICPVLEDRVKLQK